MTSAPLDEFDESVRPMLPWVGAMVILAARLEFAVRYIRSRAIAFPLKQNDGVDTVISDIRRAMRSADGADAEAERVAAWAQRSKSALDRRGTLAHALWSVDSDVLPGDLHRSGMSEEDVYAYVAGSVFASNLRRDTNEHVTVDSLSELCSQMLALLERAGRIAKQAHNVFERRRSQNESEDRLLPDGD